MKILSFLFALIPAVMFGQNFENPIDVIHYDLDLAINDSSDIIYGVELIEFDYTSECDSFYFDLSSINKEGKGMIVSSVLRLSDETSPAKFSHRNDQLWIYNSSKSKSKKIIIEYMGIPIDGLVIGENKFKQRTFFGDNWPDRAHHWFACVDHPSDKATVNFTIDAPEKYQVIATGENVDNHINHNKTITHSFESKIDLPTKVMVFGAAKFKTEQINSFYDFPLTSWIYKHEKENAFHDLDPASDILTFFIGNIGAYPFEKLANVQSTTRYGGMENAGNIFYDENSFTAKGTMEALVAHEIAHQWFGNSASEKDWIHLWLSEGFATYFTDLYWENKYGTEEMNKRLINERSKVVKFSKQYNHAVIDTNYANLIHLLNPNSYQKGAWVLHMLRNEVGDDVFWKIIKTYYAKYQYSNATSSDFSSIVKTVSGKDYRFFFQQWLERAGQPKINIDITQEKGITSVKIEQQQKEDAFVFSIEILIVYTDGSKELVNYSITEKTFSTSFSINKKVDHFVIDPNVKLLFE